MNCLASLKQNFDLSCGHKGVLGIQNKDTSAGARLIWISRISFICHLCDLFIIVFSTTLGQVSAQRAMLVVKQYKKKFAASVDGYIEEGVVRRELADNFCYYNEHYDSIEGNVAWIDGLIVQDRSISSANALGILQPCTHRFSQPPVHPCFARAIELIAHPKITQILSITWGFSWKVAFCTP